MASLENITKQLLNFNALAFQHILRKGNKLVNMLANEGLNFTLELMESLWEQIFVAQWKHECQDIVEQDKVP